MKLAVRRARATGAPAVFWLDSNRAHDINIITKVVSCLKENDTNGLEIRIMSPVKAMRYSLDRIRKGLDTISVTGRPDVVCRSPARVRTAALLEYQ